MFGYIRLFVIKCNWMCVEETKRSICRLVVGLTTSIWDVCVRLFAVLKYLRVKYFKFLKQGVFKKKKPIKECVNDSSGFVSMDSQVEVDC